MSHTARPLGFPATSYLAMDECWEARPHTSIFAEFYDTLFDISCVLNLQLPKCYHNSSKTLASHVWLVISCSTGTERAIRCGSPLFSSGNKYMICLFCCCECVTCFTVIVSSQVNAAKHSKTRWGPRVVCCYINVENSDRLIMYAADTVPHYDSGKWSVTFSLA